MSAPSYDSGLNSFPQSPFTHFPVEGNLDTNPNDSMAPEQAVNTAQAYIQSSFESMQMFTETISAQQAAIDRMLTETYEETERVERRLAFLKGVDATLKQRLNDLQKVREAAYRVNQLFSEALNSESKANDFNETEKSADVAMTRPMARPAHY